MSPWERFVKDVENLCPFVHESMLSYGVHISLRHRYIYVETPKVACTTIKLALQRLEWGDSDYYPDNMEVIHLRECSPLLTPRQILSFPSALKNPYYFKFCFVRNPYTLL